MFPKVSIAAHVTDVTPTMNADPEEGLHETWGELSTLSVAVGSGQNTCEDVMTRSTGHVIVGATWSTATKMMKKKKEEQINFHHNFQLTLRNTDNNVSI